MDLLEVVDGFSTRDTPDKDNEKIELVVLTCNQEAMKYLRDSNFTMSLDLLRKAEKMLSEEYTRSPNETIYKLIGVTLNNLGCYYKKMNKLKVALTYLKKALQIEVRTLNDNVNIASTHLNICAIHSSMMQHDDAIKHVKQALELLENERNNHMLSVVGDNRQDKDQENSELAAKYKSIITTTIMAYYNYGIELEHIKDLTNCLKALTRGFELANRELGSDHSLTENLRETIQKLVEKKKGVDAKSQKREEYMMKVLELNKSMAGDPGELAEFAVKNKTRKASSVQRPIKKTVNGKPKQKTAAKAIDRSMEVTSNAPSVYGSHNSSTTLPEIKPRAKKETKPPLRRRRQESAEKNLTNISIGLPRLPVVQDNTSPTAGSEHKKFNIRNNPYKKKDIPIHEKNGRQPLETEIQNLNSQISRLKGEILHIDGEDSINEHISSQVQATPSQRGYGSHFNRSVVESSKVNQMDFESRVLETESSRFNLNVSGYDLDQPKQRGSRSPKDEEKYQDEIRTRFLKHRYFVPKRNIPPVQLKKSLYNVGDESTRRGDLSVSSKRSLEHHFSKVKNQHVEDLVEENTQRDGKDDSFEQSLQKEKKDKVHAYMQYFD